jgi:hypothetical protein
MSRKKTTTARNALGTIQSFPLELIPVIEFLLMSSLEDVRALIRDPLRPTRERELALFVLKMIKSGDINALFSLVDRVLSQSGMSFEEGSRRAG